MDTVRTISSINHVDDKIYISAPPSFVSRRISFPYRSHFAIAQRNQLPFDKLRRFVKTETARWGSTSNCGPDRDAYAPVHASDSPFPETIVQKLRSEIKVQRKYGNVCTTDSLLISIDTSRSPAPYKPPNVFVPISERR